MLGCRRPARTGVSGCPYKRQVLIVHRAESAATLAGELAALLAANPPADAFTPEVVAVPAKGMQRWLNQQLATVLGAAAGDGVAANIEYLAPAGLLARLGAAATGIDPAEDPWSPERLPWRLLEVFDAALEAPVAPTWSAVLLRHLRAGAGRRYPTAAHFASLFASYEAERPAMVREWAAGASTDGAGSQLDGDVAWQAALWREVRSAIGVPSPAERIPQICAALREPPEHTLLPERVSVFGLTRLGADQQLVLEAFAGCREVHVWLVHPSPALWQTLQSGPATPIIRRRAGQSVLAVRHPLLASLGRDVRELQARLDPGKDIYHPGSSAAGTVLHSLRADIAANRAPATGLSPDSSISVHACHGPARQVEVLRECLMRAFADDPALEPHEVLVLCPDVAAYAPLIRAVFGQASSGHPAAQLRVRLADQALAQTNPLLAVLSTVLELVRGRVTASEVLDLAATAPVRARCRFTDDDLERLREWTAEAGARWGLDNREREAHGLTGFPQNTFSTALDRILLGITAEDNGAGGWLGLTLPLDDVESNDVDLAGRFAEYVDRLTVTLSRLAGPMPAQSWIAALEQALDLLTAVGPGEDGQLAQAKSELAQAAIHAGQGELDLTDVRALLAGQLTGRPARVNFGSGDLTVAGLGPVRSVPHRVIALLGLDDDVFPRAGTDNGDNILARDPLVAERDPRSTDRQLLLEAILAAQDRLLVLYTGADPITGAERPPAVPLAELLDVLSISLGSVNKLVTRHPLQPFDPRNFRAAAPFSFDTAALAAAQALQANPVPAPPLLEGVLPPVGMPDGELDELAEFVEQPVRGFLRQRLKLRLPDLEETLSDELPAQMRGLPEWDIGARLLEHLLDGGAPGEFWDAEWRRGTLPPFALGQQVRARVEGAAERLFRAAKPIYAGAAQVLGVNIDIGGGRRLTGTVPSVYAGDGAELVLAGVTFSRLGPRHRIGAWVRLLALAVQYPDSRWRAVTLGRGQFSRPAWQSVLTPPLGGPDGARTALRALVELRDSGLCEPLPIAAGASSAYAARIAGGSTEEEALEAAAKEFNSGFGDQSERHLRFVFGPAPDFATIFTGDILDRFTGLARMMWEPLLAMETLGPPS